MTKQENYFIEMIQRFSKKAYSTAFIHGFWETEHDRNPANKILLMITELSEAYEAVRHNNPADKDCPDFSNLEIELADCIVRILDFTEYNKLNLAAAILAKMEFNKTRPYKHGKKF